MEGSEVMREYLWPKRRRSCSELVGRTDLGLLRQGGAATLEALRAVRQVGQL